MKKAFATLAATGVLTLGALAGTTAAASAATPAPSASSSYRIGPFPTAGICEQYVWDHGEWGVWDCENYGDGWYAYI